MFSNDEIDSSNLPQAEDVDWQSMDSRLLRRQQTEGVIATLTVVIGIFILQSFLTNVLAEENPDISFGYLWLIPIFVGSVSTIWPIISVPKKGFAIRDKDIIYKSGVFWHTVTAVPFNRVQHVEKSSTPLDRRFDLATLQLFTAGGSGGDLKIHGLGTELAERMRTYILEKTGTTVERH